MIVSLLCAMAVTQEIELAEPFLATVAGKAIQFEVGHLAPILADIDGDGLDDLLVGDFMPGGIRFFKNVGKKGGPLFESDSMLRAGGEEIRIEAG